MTRNEHLNKILELGNSHNNLVLQLSTGVGKTRMAIELLKKWNCKNVLVVLYYNTLSNEWITEKEKWNYNDNFCFVNYKSLLKVVNKNWDCIVFDEVHHYTERADDAILISKLTCSHMIALSATIPKIVKDRLRDTFGNIYVYKVDLRNAIEDNILPDPKVQLIQLQLDNTLLLETIVKNEKKGNPIQLTYNERFVKIKDRKVIIPCTEQQYYEYISNRVEYFKRQYELSRNFVMKNLWLQTAGKRLKWLSDKKNNILLDILKKLDDKRTITFCNSIQQAELLGKNCINSKNKESDELLKKFNNLEINHITCIDMLNEGKNLTNCEVGIYASLTNSNIRIKQQGGRLLRHKEPLFIIPYYVNTRDEDIVAKMVNDYNVDLITITTNFKKN